MNTNLTESPQAPATTVSVANLYLLSGHVVDDLDEVQHIIEASSNWHAEERFKEQLREQNCGDEDTEIFITLCAPLSEAIAERLYASA